MKLNDLRLTKNFSLKEFACNDEANTSVPEKYLTNCMRLARALQIVRDILGKKIKITSGYRTKEYNKKVGGKKRSQHRTASASDVQAEDTEPREVADIIQQLMDEGRIPLGGLNAYRTFTHYDIRGWEAKW